MSPETVGVDADKLKTALDYIAQNAGKDGISQTLVLVDAKLIYAGSDVDKVHNVYSVTKSFVSTALGLMISEGLVELDTPICKIASEYCEKYPSVTFRHLITMTSGYNAEGPNRWGEDSADWSATPFLQAEPLFEPGSAFAYWDEAMIVLGHVLTKVAQKSLYEYLDQGLMRPLEIREWSWWHEPDAVNGIDLNYGPGGIELSAISLAKFGQLFLQNGTWISEQGAQQIVPSTWVDMAKVNQVPTSVELADTDRRDINGIGSYGYNWWVNGKNVKGERHMPNAPASMYYARGFNNNMLFVIPEWNMVVVRMGLDDEKRIDKVAFYDAFFKRLKEAVK